MSEGQKDPALTQSRVGDIVDIKANGAVQKGFVLPQILLVPSNILQAFEKEY